jgi:hypothetical protein
MTTVTIAPENPDTGKNIWRAIAGDKQSIGETAGEALDALTSQLSENESSSVVVIRRWQPDRFHRSPTATPERVDVKVARRARFRR